MTADLRLVENYRGGYVLKKNKIKKAHSDTFLSHGTAERAVLFKALLRTAAVGLTAFTRKLLLTRLTLALVH